MRVLITNPPVVTYEEENVNIYVRAGARWPSKKKEVCKGGTVKKSERYTPFPFFLAYTAAILRDAGHQVSVIDAGALWLSREEYISRSVESSPELVLMETSTPTIKIDLDYARELKEKTGASVVLSGPHASVFPEEILGENPFVDFIAAGEYEYTISELADTLASGSDLANVKGLAYRKDGKVEVNEKRELIEPLDDLPYPARDMFPVNSDPDIEVYHDGFAKVVPSVQIISSRGCPFRCNYCVWPQIIYNSNKYRMFSPSRVVDEIEHCIEKYDPRSFYFDDDSFTINKKHVLGICREIMDRKLKIKWSCMGDAMAIDKEMIAEMSRSGCVAMKFGVESVDAEVLKNTGKPLDVSKVLEVVEWCKQYGIRTHATFCLGLLGDTEDSIRKTIDFATKLDVDGVQFSSAIPYPGTRFYNTLDEKGYLREEDGIYTFNYPGLSAEKIASLHAEANKRWEDRKIRDARWIIRRTLQNYREAGLTDLTRSIKNGINMFFNSFN